MNQALQHRGPDDQSTYIDERVCLGHRRLAIIDLTPAGRQPKCNEDGSIWIVFNGEIYNFQEIRPNLEERGHKFSSNTDTEVIIHAYEEWGEDCVQRFNGMWAFAIYDKNRGLLFLSRDRFGVKPLYFSRNERGLIFSSEIKGILKHPLERAANDRAVYDYLVSGFVDHLPETFFRGIERLMPGYSMIFRLSDGSLETRRWYDLNEKKSLNKSISEEDMAEGDVAKRIRELFMDSVRYRLISDVPVGSCLSGGIDSSSIVYAMRKLKEDAEIKTFSLVFPGKRMDESAFIDQVVEETRVEAHSTSPSTEDLIKDLSDLIRTQEEPFGSLSIYGQYKVMQLANRSGMKVLLDGQGSDEIFAGYFIYYKYYFFESLLRFRLREARETANRMKSRLSDMLLFPAMTVISRLGLSGRWTERIWFSRLRHLQWSGGMKLANPLAERGFDLNRALLSDLCRYSIPQLLRYEDKNSMRWSIETRVPFLDFRLVEMAASLPSGCKIRGGTTKYILRAALRDLVSERILGRRDKIGFAAPDDDWLMSPDFVGMAQEIFASSIFRCRRYWKSQMVMEMLNEHTGAGGRKRKNHSEALWRIINVELWMRLFIDLPCSGDNQTPPGQENS